MEVDDAGAQHEPAADDSVGDEHLAAALDGAEQLAIQRVEVYSATRGSLRRGRSAGGT